MSLAEKIKQGVDRRAAGSQQRLQKAAQFIEQRLAAAVDTPHPPASRPGNPPHLRTGNLQRSIYARASGDTISVGATVPYATMLEYGTGRMAARPFFRRTLDSIAPAVRDILRGS